eukprot:TRINITY_DN95933_c0_g1_i1.p1 TRINITY_DN95933_c0_g1~~TRINITY_DN95933_c0_g1_i1.p1  ORF type:complete len:267 (-),score=21.32 TRINITY_DN95933_c0_g1_i1:154-954(-)
MAQSAFSAFRHADARTRLVHQTSRSPWFAQPTVTPDRCGIKAYQNGPVHVGMMHPPQNPAVRQDLLGYLHDCGIQPPKPVVRQPLIVRRAVRSVSTSELQPLKRSAALSSAPSAPAAPDHQARVQRMYPVPLQQPQNAFRPSGLNPVRSQSVAPLLTPPGTPPKRRSRLDTDEVSCYSPSHASQDASQKRRNGNRVFHPICHKESAFKKQVDGDTPELVMKAMAGRLRRQASNVRLEHRARDTAEIIELTVKHNAVMRQLSLLDDP